MDYTTTELRAKGPYRVSGWSMALGDTVYECGVFDTFGEALTFARTASAVWDANAFLDGDKPDVVFDVSIKTSTLGAYEMVGYVNSWVDSTLDIDGDWFPIIATEFEEVF